MPRSALKSYLPQGLFLALLWLVIGLKLAVSLPVLLLVFLAMYLLGVWLAHITAAVWQSSRRRASGLTVWRPPRRETVGIGLGLIIGLALGMAVSIARSPGIQAQLLVLLPLLGAWLGRQLARLRLSFWRWSRPSWLFWQTLLPLRRLLLMLGGALLSSFLLLTADVVETAVTLSQLATTVATGAGLGLLVDWLLPRLWRWLPTLWLWAAGPRLLGGVLGTLFGGVWEAGLLAPAPLAESAPEILLVALVAGLLGWLAVAFILQVLGGIWRQLALWVLLATAVVSALLVWLPPLTLTPGQVLLAGIGSGTLISLLFIRPKPRVLVRSSIGGLLGVMLVSLNLETAVAPVSALVGIFFGLMATLILLNWLQTRRA